MDSKTLRKKFIQFFTSRGHQVLPPSSLVPENDPSVLFTTAGMQQFKRFYTHPEEAPTKNIVTCQPCLRTSDIDLVGDDTHLTFFEMLGNFSFGGYFKEETIKWAYEFLTKELKIDAEKIDCSIFSGDKENPRDQESAKILEKMAIKFRELGRKDNFWGPTGDEGPCGPTVEFYLSAEASAKADINNIEVWNLVFNEYYKTADGKFEPLKTKGVDTGMGLERMLAVLNGSRDVYETDVFEPIIKKVELATQKKYQDFKIRFRRIADHYRSIIALIDEDILPGKNKREYTLRVLLRVLFIEINNIMQPIRKPSDPRQAIHEIFHPWPEVIKIFFNECDDEIRDIVDQEYQNFRAMEKPGTLYFEKNQDQPIITGEIIFQGRDTFGLMPTGVVDIFKKFGKKISENWEKEYKIAFDKHREISRAGISGFKGGLIGESEINTRMHTATHLLLKALQMVLGPGVHQRGSNINSERIRFDFSYSKPIAEEEIKKVEEIVNQKISENLPVEKKEVSLDEAKKMGAEAQFVEKYTKYDKLTLYSINDPSTGSGQVFSHELCGGPHVKKTGEIGQFKIIKEESSSAGVRRIRARLVEDKNA